MCREYAPERTAAYGGKHKTFLVIANSRATKIEKSEYQKISKKRNWKNIRPNNINCISRVNFVRVKHGCG
jgi:hypothetical protein